MPKIIDQPADTGAIPRMRPETPTRKTLHMGVTKWAREREHIEHILIGSRRFYTDEAVNAYLRARKVKPRRSGWRHEDRSPESAAGERIPFSGAKETKHARK